MSDSPPLDPEAPSGTIASAWRGMSMGTKAGIAVGSVLLLIAAGVAGAVLAGGGGSEESQSEAAAPCDLFTPSMAAELLEDEVRRFLWAEQLPEDAPPEQRRGAAAADKTNCNYVVEGEDPEDGATASFQIDRFLFRSVEQFREGAPEESEPVEGLGRAAMLEQREDGGWNLSVLVDEEISFALVVRETEVQRQVFLRVARELVEQLDR